LDCIRAVGFYQSQPIIISGSDDATIRLTNLEPKAAPGKKVRAPPPCQIASLRGHGAPVVALAPYEDDGQQCVLSGALDGTIDVWKLPGPLVTFYEAYGQLSHHRIAEFELHRDAVWSIDVLGDRKTAVSVGAEGLAKLWTIETGEAVDLPLTEKPIGCVAICDMKFAIGCQNGTVQLFEGSSKFATVEAGEVPIRRLAATAAFVFAGSDDGQIRVVDVLAASVVGAIDGPEGGATGLCVTGDGNFLVTVGNDKMLSAWRVEGFDRVDVTNLLHATKYGEAALCCAASPAGSGKGYFATGGADGALQIFQKG
jgi:WD40 repeat protein